jgi:hypothetical protein
VTSPLIVILYSQPLIVPAYVPVDIDASHVFLTIWQNKACASTKSPAFAGLLERLLERDFFN